MPRVRGNFRLVSPRLETFSLHKVCTIPACARMFIRPVRPSIVDLDVSEDFFSRFCDRSGIYEYFSDSECPRRRWHVPGKLNLTGRNFMPSTKLNLLPIFRRSSHFKLYAGKDLNRVRTTWMNWRTAFLFILYIQKGRLTHLDSLSGLEHL